MSAPFRHRGAGARLVRTALDTAIGDGVDRVTTGIVARDTRLRDWYLGPGFHSDDTRRFDRLPFAVERPHLPVDGADADAELPGPGVRHRRPARTPVADS